MALPSHSVRSPLPPDWSSAAALPGCGWGPLGRCRSGFPLPGGALALWVCNCDNRGPWGSRSWQELCPETLASAVVFSKTWGTPDNWIWGKWDFPRRLSANMSARSCSCWTSIFPSSSLSPENDLSWCHHMILCPLGPGWIQPVDGVGRRPDAGGWAQGALGTLCTYNSADYVSQPKAMSSCGQTYVRDCTSLSFPVQGMTLSPSLH